MCVLDPVHCTLSEISGEQYFRERRFLCILDCFFPNQYGILEWIVAHVQQLPAGSNKKV